MHPKLTAIIIELELPYLLGRSIEAIADGDVGGALTLLADYSVVEPMVAEDEPMVADTPSTHCTAPGCTNKPARRGFCYKHYGEVRAKERGSQWDHLADRCEVGNCRNKAHRKGLCRRHYDELRKDGNCDNI